MAQSSETTWTPKSRLAQGMPCGPDGTSRIPKMIYGTAWKKDETPGFVYKALKTGFRALDTAGQSEHYHEPSLAVGVRQAIQEGIVERDEIFIQTKLNPPSHDLKTWPESERGIPWADRVHRLVESSLETNKIGSRKYVDSYLLHIPMDTVEETVDLWNLLSSYVPKYIGHLGVSNVHLLFLQEIWRQGRVKPSFVQNRFIRETEFDIALRRFCRQNGIVYQSFWTLTANKYLTRTQPVAEVSEKAGVSKVVAFFSLVLGLGNVSILNGTKSEEHMREDLEGIDKVGLWAEGEGAADWDTALAAFMELIGSDDASPFRPMTTLPEP